MDWNDVFILTGSNSGKRSEAIAKAADLLERRVGMLIKASQIYQSPAWGKTDQADFLNQVVQVRTDLSPRSLMNACLAIEDEMGRIRYEKWGPRLIDIDILYYNDIIVDENDLQIPHPGIQERAFTLKPLIEIDPNRIHPHNHKTAEEMLAQLRQSEVDGVQVYQY